MQQSPQSQPLPSNPHKPEKAPIRKDINPVHRSRQRPRRGSHWVPRGSNSNPIQSGNSLCEPVDANCRVEKKEPFEANSLRQALPLSAKEHEDVSESNPIEASIGQVVSLPDKDVDLSPSQLSANEKLLEDEILALESIFGENVVILERVGELRSLQISIHIYPDDDLEVKSTVDSFVYSFTTKYLPPMTLTCLFPKSYPTHHPPLFNLYVQWLSSSKISALCSKLDSIWREQSGEEVVYKWVDWLQSSSLLWINFEKEITLCPNGDEENTDPRAISGNVSPNVDVALMRKYNEDQRHERFLSSIQECCICYSQWLGSEFAKLPCEHFFCNKCLKTYSEIHVKEGTVNKLTCPDSDCGGAIPDWLLRNLLDEEKFARFESLMLEKALSSMENLAYCPRCETSTTADEEHHAICPKCLYSFCNLCRERRHLGTECMTPEMKLQLLTQRQGSSRVGEAQKQKEKDLINSLLSVKEALKDAKQCPNCRMLISKTEGCNKMECKNCGQYFCYRCSKAIEDYEHFKNGSCELFSQEEVARWEAQVNYRQAMGQVHAQLFADNLHTCPNCRQFNAKVGNNNHIFCWACQMYYCYLCRNILRRGSKHFGPRGCKQHTVG